MLITININKRKTNLILKRKMRLLVFCIFDRNKENCGSKTVLVVMGSTWFGTQDINIIIKSW